MKRARLIETNGVAIAISPQSVNAATVDGDFISMKFHGALAFIVNVGATDGIVDVNLDQALTAAGGSAKALNITRAWISAANSDVFTAATITSGEVSFSATDDNKTVVVEVDPNDLDVANLFNYVRLSVDSAGTALVSAVCILRHPKYMGLTEAGTSALA